MTAGSPNRHWRRRVTALTAGAVAVSAGLVAIPALTAGATTAVTAVTTNTGTKPTAGHPQPAATAKVAVTAAAVNPTTGDVAEMAGNQIFLLVKAANEPATNYGISTSGDLVQGDVYLVAGVGAPGWTSLTDNAATAATPVPATQTVIGTPQTVGFDAAGNLLIGSAATGQSNLIAIPKTTGSYYGFTSMTAGYPYFIAGFTASTHLPAPAINFSAAVTFVSVTATGGLVTGGVQNVAVGTLTAVDVLNFGASAHSFYGTSVTAGHATAVATGGGSCTSGAQSATASNGFPVTTPQVYADGDGNLYVANGSLTGCVWVLPKANGSLVVDGASQAVTAGKAYKVAGDGVSPRTTAPTSGASAVATQVGSVSGITVDPAGNVVIQMNGGLQSKTTINGAYVVANSNGKYYSSTTRTAGDLYPISGHAASLGSFQSPNSLGGDTSGNLYFVDSGSHTLYEETGGPTGPANTPTTTHTSLTTQPSGSARSKTSVTLKATVTPSTAAGSVEFFEGATSLGTVAVSGGHATLVVNTSAHPFATGTYHLKATFTPTTGTAFGSSTSSTVTLTITPAAGATTTPTTTKPVTTQGGTETVTQNVPSSGKFKLTVPVGAHVTMTKPVRSGNNETSTGNLVPVTVTDTRNTVPGWTVSGRTSNFSDGTHTFPGKDLGWTPAVTSQSAGQTATAGGAITAGTTPGLSAASTWATAPSGKGLGSATLGAGLTLTIPYTTHPGLYTATFTVTAI